MKRANLELVAIFVAVVVFATCGQVEGQGGVTAVKILNAPAGYACFVIYKSNNDPLAGNCVKE
jgi:hypothetical protein